MRIKFNDKIYRLKEIESGVDSLMELVEESKHKHGDFLMNDYGFAFIFDREGENGEAHHLFCTDMDGEIQSHIQEREKGVKYCGYLKHAVLADSEATEAINDGLKSIGKRWNADKKCIEDIPKRKFKAGDKVTLKSGCTSNPGLTYYSPFDEYIGKELIVIDYTKSGNVKCNNGLRFAEDWLELYVEKQQRKFKAGDKVKIKDGISSKTHWNIAPCFTSTMDKFIGKELTVKGYRGGFALISEDYCGYYFNEDWLEPYTEKLKKGELAIFWDYSKEGVTVRRYEEKAGLLHRDSLGYPWHNAIRFESKDQLDKILKGQI